MNSKRPTKPQTSGRGKPMRSTKESCVFGDVVDMFSFFRARFRRTLLLGEDVDLAHRFGARRLEGGGIVRKAEGVGDHALGKVR